MADADAALRAVVYGNVQGVGYRDFVEAVATRLGLTGYVRNQPDGSVEVTAEGPRAALERLITALKAGPRAARVDRVEERWESPAGRWQGFRINW